MLMRVATRSLQGSRQLIRSLATEATTGDGAKRLMLSLITPYEALIRKQAVEQVNLSSTDGDCGILAGHVPVILQLKPGLIEVMEGASKKSFFASGGFAIVNPDSTMEISAMECVPVEQLDSKLVADGLAELSQRTVTAGTTDEASQKAEIAIHQQVYQAMTNALQKAAASSQ